MFRFPCEMAGINRFQGNTEHGFTLNQLFGKKKIVKNILSHPSSSRFHLTVQSVNCKSSSLNGLSMKNTIVFRRTSLVMPKYVCNDCRKNVNITLCSSTNIYSYIIYIHILLRKFKFLRSTTILSKLWIGSRVIFSILNKRNNFFGKKVVAKFCHYFTFCWSFFYDDFKN